MLEVPIAPFDGQVAHDSTRASSNVRPHPTGQTDRALTAIAVAGVTVPTGLGWVLSYAALHQLCLSAGMAFWAATLWPPCIDLFVFLWPPWPQSQIAAAGAPRRTRGRWLRCTRPLRLPANVTAAGPDHLAQAVHAMPAVTMVLAWHCYPGSSRATMPSPGRFASVRTDGQPRCPVVPDAGRPSGRHGTASVCVRQWARWPPAWPSWSQPVKGRRASCSRPIGRSVIERVGGCWSTFEPHRPPALAG
jgi:hypothetical protein